MSHRNLYIIRHGESASNAGLWDFNKPDGMIPLTERGKQQAYTLGTVFAEQYKGVSEPNKYFFSSPYRRAIETTQKIIEGMQSCKLTDIYGPTIIPDLMERNLINHSLIREELVKMDQMCDAERFFYSSEHVESAMLAAARIQRTIYDIRNWSRSGRHADEPMDIFVVGHSMAFEAWEYLETINHNNSVCSPEARIFPVNMEGFGEKRRLKNCEFRKFEFES